MAVKATLRLEGGKELERKLKTLPTRVRNKVVRTALRAGAKIVHAETKQLAPERSGRLKRAVKVRAAKRKKGRIGINVQIGEGDFKGETFYSGFVVYGHHLGKRSNAIKRAQRKGRHGADEGDTRRFVAGNNFPLEAFNRKAPQAAQVIEHQLKTGIESEATKG